MKNNIYIDCTELYFSRINTGIQRVERNIISSAFDLSEKTENKIIPVIFLGKAAGLRELKIKDQKIDYSNRYFERIYLSALNPNRLKKLTQACLPFFEDHIEKTWQKYRLFFLLPLALVIPPLVILAMLYVLSSKKFVVKKNDIYFIPGSSWWALDLEWLLKDIKKYKATIAILLHDLIPLTHPTIVNNQFKITFTKKINPTIRQTDLIICISEYTHNTLDSYLKNHEIKNPPKTAINYSGFKLDLIDNQNSIRPETSVINSAYIAVGTVEPRKNYSYLLDAFDLAWQNNITPTLCIIGKYGWKSEKIVERILSHPQYGKRLFWFNDLNDNELLYAYQHAKACVYPSIVEGFGLPLIEALSLKCPVLASDIPVFHEVGGDYCHYFSLDDPKHLSDLIEKVEHQGLLDDLSYLNSFSWPDWNESTTNLLKILSDL